MKKYFWKMIFIAGFIFILAIKYVDVTFGENEFNKIVREPEMQTYILENAWQKLRISEGETSVSIDGWVVVNKKFCRQRELASLVEESGKKLGVRWDPGSEMASEEEKFCYWNRQGLWEGLSATIIAQSQAGDAPDQAETSLGIALVGNYKKGMVNRIINRLHEVLSEKGKCSVDVVMQGSIGRPLTVESRKNLEQEVRNTLPGEVFPGIMGTDGLAGYTPSVKNSIVISGKRINWQLLWRDSLDTQNTEVILASPMYLQEY